MKNNQSPKKISCIQIFIIGGILLILISALIPNYNRNWQPPSDRRRKACYSNIRIIQGAVEMYNMDSSEMMNALDMNKLQESHYLKENPIVPDEPCEYYGNNLDNDGSVYCYIHGDLQGTTAEKEGLYDKLKNRKKYENNKLDLLRYIRSDNIIEFLIRLLFMPIYIILYFLGQIYYFIISR